MQIIEVGNHDIPAWMVLSSEYDQYVMELVSNITEWYNGDEHSPSFNDYMESKIQKKEAFMAIDDSGECLGIIAISKKNNRITFFAVSHKSDITSIGGALLKYALGLLDDSQVIGINEIKSSSPWILAHYELLQSYGFVCVGDSFESGVPVNCFIASNTFS